MNTAVKNTTFHYIAYTECVGIAHSDMKKNLNKKLLSLSSFLPSGRNMGVGGGGGEQAP